jgi:hypothetical protein
MARIPAALNQRKNFSFTISPPISFSKF